MEPGAPAPGAPCASSHRAPSPAGATRGRRYRPSGARGGRRRRRSAGVPGQGPPDVGILLDGAALAEVGHAGAAILAALDGAVELRQGDDGHLQLSGQRLEPPADLGDLLLAAVARILRLDELDVVEDDEADL